MSQHKLSENKKTLHQQASIWLKDLSDLFASVSAKATTLSEQEINAAIDDAVRAVRKAHREAA